MNRARQSQAEGKDSREATLAYRIAGCVEALSRRGAPLAMRPRAVRHKRSHRLAGRLLGAVTAAFRHAGATLAVWQCASLRANLGLSG